MDRNEMARMKSREKKQTDDKMVSAIKEADRAIPVLKELLKIKQEDFNIMMKIQEIILTKPNKITPDFEYENDIEYQKLIAEKQVTTNKLLILEKKNELRSLEDKIKELNEISVSYKAQLNFMEGE